MTKETRAVRRLFCWSGGGFPGLDIHCGLWLALEARGIRADAHLGTSAGAAIAAMAAAGHSVSYVASMVEALTEDSLRQERFAWRVRARWLTDFLGHEPISALLERELPENFSDLQTPLGVCMTRVRDGRLVVASQKSHIPLRRAVLASMSIHGVFPTVPIDGDDYADGGPRAYLPAPEKFEDCRNFDEVWLLVAARQPRYAGRDWILTRALRNVEWMVRDQVEDAVERVRSWRHAKVMVLWPDFNGDVGALRFDHDLIDSARLFAAGVLGSVK